MRKRFTEEQIIGFLKEAEAGVAIKELCRKLCFSDASKSQTGTPVVPRGWLGCAAPTATPRGDGRA